ncbi:MAG: hypothetical protein VKI42_02250 [Synechococcaceae cyanobacterium]|nr:hypothetical protein [Synechococcaceae cyanobacterium]
MRDAPCRLRLATTALHQSLLTEVRGVQEEPTCLQRLVAGAGGGSGRPDVGP